MNCALGISRWPDGLKEAEWSVLGKGWEASRRSTEEGAPIPSKGGPVSLPAGDGLLLMVWVMSREGATGHDEGMGGRRTHASSMWHSGPCGWGGAGLGRVQLKIESGF